MPVEKLFGTRDRAASHKKLEDVLTEGEYPRASCREDPNDLEEPYTVWSDGPEPHVSLPSLPVPTQEDVLDQLARKLLERIRKELIP